MMIDSYGFTVLNRILKILRPVDGLGSWSGANDSCQ